MFLFRRPLLQWLIFFFSLLPILDFSFAQAAIGGVPTSERVHSSIVNIVFKKSACSGVVIGKHTILTASHCIDKGGEPLKVAFIQPNKVTASCDVQDVTDYAHEPSARKTKFKVHTPDLLLLKIAAPLCSAKKAVMSDEVIQPSDTLSMAGHSRWEFGHGLPTQIDAQVIPFEDVSKNIFVEKSRLAKKVTENFMKEGTENYLFALPLKNGSTICTGDSGGPVFTESNGEMYLHGVNGVVLSNEKLGSKKCDYAYVQAFTPIAPYMDWIKTKLTEWQ